MKFYFLIGFLFVDRFAIAQKEMKIDQHCTRPLITKEIAWIDSLPLHHSFCVEIYKIGKDKKVIMSSIVCDTSNGNTEFLYDTSLIGMRWNYYPDTFNRTSYRVNAFEIVLKNNVIIECYSYQYFDSIRVRSKEGYIRGEPVKIEYEYNEWGLSKQITTTMTEIKTIIYTREKDYQGNYIQRVTTSPVNRQRDDE